MVRRRMLAGDMLAALVGSTGSGPDPLPPRARSGPTDPQSVLEFVLYDIPFRTEPAVGVVFPPEVPRG